jgi:PAS domain S-box-containing protein
MTVFATQRVVPAGEDRQMLELIDILGDWRWASDAGGQICELSPGFQGAAGMAPEQLLGQYLADIDGLDAAGVGGTDENRVARALFEHGRPFRELLLRLAGPEDTVVWLEIAGVPTIEHGRFCGYRGVGRNVTKRVQQLHALERSEQLVTAASDWFFESEPTGLLTYISSNVVAAMGLPVSAYVGKRLAETEGVIIDPERAKFVVAAVRAHKPYRDFVYARKMADGKLVWIRTSGTPFFDANGALRGYRGIAKDVTAEIEAEQKLKASEKRFRELFEIAADHYWEVNLLQEVTYISPNYEAITGIPATEIVGRRLDQNPRIAVSPEVGRKTLIAVKARQPYRDFVYSYAHPDGRKRWISLNGAPVFGADGEFQGYRGVGADITERVEAEQTARLSQRRLHDAVSHVTQAVVVYDADNSVVAFNQAFADLYRVPGVNTPVCAGVLGSELIDWQLRVGFYADGPEDEKVTREGLLDAFQNGGEHSYHLHDGRWMMAIYRRLPGDGHVGVWTDITAIKQVEAARRALEQQLHHSQRLESLGTLAGGVAHELNNALVPVIALTKLVARKLEDDSRERRNLEIVVGAAERSRDLVGQILAFSRHENQRVRQRVDLGEVLHKALSLLRATLPATIAIAEEIAPMPPIEADPGQLQQIVINLMTNAAHAIGEATGTIAVRLEQRAGGRDLCLSVADSGCGMDEATRTRIFEPFFTTKEVGKGTGLGLSVVHGIVNDHGGRIEVESAPGKGTRFDVILPVGVSGGIDTVRN